MITALLAYLKRHPYVGAAASTGSSLITAIEMLAPTLRLAALVVGLLIGLVTLMIKWQEHKIKKLVREDLEKKDISKETLRDHVDDID